MYITSTAVKYKPNKGSRITLGPLSLCYKNKWVIAALKHENYKQAEDILEGIVVFWRQSDLDIAKNAGRAVIVRLLQDYEKAQQTPQPEVEDVTVQSLNL